MNQLKRYSDENREAIERYLKLVAVIVKLC
jgi:hypothetical protein